MSDYRFRISRVRGKIKLWIPGPLDVEEARFLAEQILEFCDSPDTSTVVWGGEPPPSGDEDDRPSELVTTPRPQRSVPRARA